MVGSVAYKVWVAENIFVVDGKPDECQLWANHFKSRCLIPNGIKSVVSCTDTNKLISNQLV